MKPGRQSSVANPSAVSSATEDQVRQIADGYVGYFGLFSVEGDAELTTLKLALYLRGQERIRRGNASLSAISLCFGLAQTS